MPESTPRATPADRSAATERKYPLTLTRAEIGMCIDGLAKLVGPDEREAAQLLHDFQRLYRITKELEPSGR